LTGPDSFLSGPVYLIDSSAYIFRSYFAGENRYWNPAGQPVGAVHGFARFLLRLLLEQQPTHLLAAFDESLFSGFRHQLYPDYKANRALPDADLAFQLEACQSVAVSLGVAVQASTEWEADDLIASAARFARERQYQVIILTRDKDLQQLLLGSTSIWDYGFSQPVTRRDFVDRWGFEPEQWPDWQALVGDPVDCIPGIAGVGAKTATALMQLYPDLESLIADPEAAAGLAVRGAASLPARLRSGAEQLRATIRLTRLQDGIATLERPGQLARGAIDGDQCRSLFDQLGLSALNRQLARLEAGPERVDCS